MEIISLIKLSAMFLGAFGIGEILYHYFHVEVEITRKWSHISAGLISLLFPYFFKDIQWVILLCLLFAVILAVSKKFNQLQSIHKVERTTYGSYLFPLAVIISFAAFQWKNHQYLYFYLPVLHLAICDLSAALVGKRYPLKKIKIHKEHKSLGGFLAFLVTSLFLQLVLLLLGFQIPLVFMFSCAIIAAFAELFSPKGFDNITIPLTVVIVMHLFQL